MVAVWPDRHSSGALPLLARNLVTSKHPSRAFVLRAVPSGAVPRWGGNHIRSRRSLGRSFEPFDPPGWTRHGTLTQPVSIARLPSGS